MISQPFDGTGNIENENYILQFIFFLSCEISISFYAIPAGKFKNPLHLFVYMRLNCCLDVL